MTQGILPFKYEASKEKTGMTSLGGLPLYMDLAHVMGLSKSITKHIGVRRESQGWTDNQIVTSLLLLNLAGGDSVEDLKVLESDEGFCRILHRVETHGLRRKERRELERRWRKEKRRTIPSSSAVFRYLASFHDPGQEKLRQPGKAFIPESNKYLDGFSKVNKDFLSFVQSNSPCATATLDMDATLVETSKESAVYCYKGFKSYQPLNTWWAEQGLVIHTEFRDGNVPAGYDQLRVLQEALSLLLPSGVEKVMLRSDTAGYQHNLLRYCASGENKRFGKIEFAIGCDVTKEFKKAVSEISESDWQPLYKTYDGVKIKTETEWAEVCFVPNAIGHSKNGPEYRYIAKRTVIRQQDLPGIESQQELPFPTMKMQSIKYKIFGIVTNMDWEGERLINWHHERCGKSEEAHSIMKKDLAGGRLPSNDFGENAAWWWIMILALNLNAAMKSLVLGKSWVTKRMKAIRFSLINLPARVLERSRSLLIRIMKDHPMYDYLLEFRRKILMLIPAPG